MSAPSHTVPDPSSLSPRIFDSSTDLMCVRDMQGRIVRVNKAWETTLGISIDEVTNVPLLPLIHPADVPATLQRMAEADRCDRIVGFVNRYRRRDGRYCHMEWQAQRVGDVILGRARDITMRCLQEDKLRVATEALNETLADIGDRISVPADTILRTVEALKRKKQTPDQLALIQTIAGSVQTLEHLVSRLIEREQKAAWAAFLGTIERDLVDRVTGLSVRFRPKLPQSAFERTIGSATVSSVDRDRSLDDWVSDTLDYLHGHPVYDRNFRDIASQILGLLSIGLEHDGHFYPRRLLGLSAKSGLMSAGRAAALLARMQDIGFVDVVGEFRAGQIRRYCILPPMKQAFVGQMVVNLKSLAASDYRARLALEKIEEDGKWATSILARYAEALLKDHVSGKGEQEGRFNGALSMAKGLSIALSIASDAIQSHGSTWEGWIEIALTSYARRFDVSRVHVRRVIDSLEPCGLRRDPASPSRLLITSRFRDEVGNYRMATCDLLAGVLERFI